jgi:beta-galactosidase
LQSLQDTQKTGDAEERGPASTYADCRSGKIGICQNRAAENMARYLVPRECGAKMDTRWAEVTDAAGHGLFFALPDLFFPALPYTPDEIDDASHTDELPPVVHTIVRVGLQMGVGGDDTWGARTHPEYLLPAGQDLELSFCFRGL